MGLSVAPSAQAVADAVGREMYARDNATQWLGIGLDEIRPGYARMSMSVRKDMLNGHDICHGGLIFTLADSTFAFACNSHNFVTVAQMANITFVAAGRLDDRLTATAVEQTAGGRTGVYDVTVTRQDGTVIALFRGNSYRIKGAVVPDLNQTS